MVVSSFASGVATKTTMIASTLRTTGRVKSSLLSHMGHRQEKRSFVAKTSSEIAGEAAADTPLLGMG